MKSHTTEVVKEPNAQLDFLHHFIWRWRRAAERPTNAVAQENGDLLFQPSGLSAHISLHIWSDGAAFPCLSEQLHAYNIVIGGVMSRPSNMTQTNKTELTEQQPL